MSTHLSKLFLVAILACPIAHSAKASIIERTGQLDLASLLLPTSDLTSVTPVAPFTLDVGDTLIFHLQFLGGRLNIMDSVANANDYIGLQFLSNPAGQTGFLFSGHWYFEDVVGDLLTNNLSFIYGGPIGGFTANTNLTDSSFSLSAITYTVNVTYKENGRPPFTADAVQFDAYTAGRASNAISVQAVPAPSTISLVALSFACLILAMNWNRCRI